VPTSTNSSDTDASAAISTKKSLSVVWPDVDASSGTKNDAGGTG
jgi:hypothetical protein